MSISKILVLGCFLLFGSVTYAQDFISTEEAFVTLEQKQSNVNTLYNNGALTKLDHEIREYYFEIIIYYLKEEKAVVAYALDVAFDKALQRFDFYEEGVISFRDELLVDLTTN